MPEADVAWSGSRQLLTYADAQQAAADAPRARILLYVSSYSYQCICVLIHLLLILVHAYVYRYSCYCMCRHTVESSDSTQLVTLDSTSLVSVFSVRADIHQAKTGILSDSGMCCASADVC